jgi:DNA recombination-dependent growth factor C
MGRHQVLGPVPQFQELLNGLHQDRFHPFEDGLEEERIGWCDWTSLLLEPGEANLVQGRFWAFSLRIDTRKVPDALLKAHVQQRLKQLMEDKDLAFIGKEARISLQDQVKAELIVKVTPSPKAYEVVWDYKAGRIYTSATSSKAQGALSGLFVKSFGAELQPIAPLVLAGQVDPSIPSEFLLSLDPLDLEVRP